MFQKIKDERADAWIEGDDDYYDDGREIFEDEDDEETPEDKKKAKDIKKRNKFAKGTRNITSMFLQAKKKKKTTGSWQAIVRKKRMNCIELIEYPQRRF